MILIGTPKGKCDDMNKVLDNAEFIEWYEKEKLSISLIDRMLDSDHRKEHYLRKGFFAHQDEIQRLNTELELAERKITLVLEYGLGPEDLKYSIDGEGRRFPEDYKTNQELEEENKLLRSRAHNLHLSTDQVISTKLANTEAQNEFLRRELNQQRFNNLHNLSIDQPIADEIAKLKREKETLHSALDAWIRWETKQIAKDGEYCEKEINALIKYAKQALEEVKLDV